MNGQQTPVIERSIQVYRALLWLYPRQHREEYGWLMVQLYRDKAYDTFAQAGEIGILWHWLVTLWDLLTSVIAERRACGLTISLHPFARIQTPGMVLGGLLISISALGFLKPIPWYRPSLFYDTVEKLMIPGFFIFGIGFCGAYLAHRQMMPITAKVSLILVVSGCWIYGISSIVESTFSVNYWSEYGWVIFMGIYIEMVLSLLAFGISLAREGYRFAYIATIPFIVTLLAFVYLFLAREPDYRDAGPYWDGFISFFSFGLTLLMLGYKLRKPLRKNLVSPGIMPPRRITSTARS